MEYFCEIHIFDTDHQEYGSFHQWGYPQLSFISRSFPEILTNQLLGIPNDELETPQNRGPESQVAVSTKPGREHGLTVTARR